jgi:hypothetical protein
MAMLSGQSCRALVAQVLLMNFNCVQRCQDFVTSVALGCGPIVSPRIGRRLESPPHEQQPTTSHLRVDAGPCIAEW